MKQRLVFLFAMALTTLSASAADAQVRVLIYGPGDSGNAQTYFPPGTMTTVATEAVWRGMTTEDFEQFDVIWLNAGTCQTTSPFMEAAFDTQDAWGPAARGRAVYTTADHVFHAPSNATARSVIASSVGWLGGLGSTTEGGATGVWWSWSCVQHPTPPDRTAADLTVFPGITIDNGSVETNAATVATHPTLVGATAAGLRYGSFCHGRISAQPAEWTPLVTCTGGNQAFMVRDAQACTGATDLGPFSVNEGANGTLSATGLPVGAVVSWDLDLDGTFETNGAMAMYDASAIDGPATRNVDVRVGGVGCFGVHRVAVNIANVAPTVTSTPPDTVDVGDVFTYTATATDPAGADDPLTWTMVSGPMWVTVTPGGEVSGTPPAGTEGTTVVIVVEVSDGDGGTTQQEIRIAVVECRSAMDCNDGAECTTDACSDAGLCLNTPLMAGTMCAGGNVCDGGTMCVECVDATQCDDGNECTVDMCTANSCGNTSSPAGTLCSAGACDGADSAPMCLACVDTEAGSGTDAGCNMLTPLCDASGDAPTCVECLADGDCPGGVCDLGNNMCAPCVDSAMGGALDQGCEAAAPLCVGAGDDRACVPCVDDAMGATVDSGCEMGAPVCDTSAAIPSCEVCIAGGDTPHAGCADPAALCDDSEAPRECVGCLTDDECDAGQICSPSGMCGMGCRIDADCAMAVGTPVCDTTAEVCVECITSEQCDGDDVCTDERTCVECVGSSDCEDGQQCSPSTEQCVECLNDANCPEGLVCTGEQCVPECRTDANCAEGVCDAGVCTPCTRDAECEGDEICSEGECGTGCTSDAECTDAATPACNLGLGLCVACVSDDECDGRCDTLTSTCVPSCVGPEDCSGARSTCDMDVGLCVECTEDADCAPNAVCDEGRGACVECTQDSECLMGETCTDAVCIGCGDDAACGAATMCDPDLMSCRGECTSDDECDNPRLPYCDSDTGQCEECREDSQCEGGETCSSDFRCEPACAEPGAAGCVCTSDDECDGVCDEALMVCVDGGDPVGGVSGGALCAAQPGSGGNKTPLGLAIIALGLLIRRRRR